jgi:hypothetical protein
MNDLKRRLAATLKLALAPAAADHVVACPR